MNLAEELRARTISPQGMMLIRAMKGEKCPKCGNGNNWATPVDGKIFMSCVPCKVQWEPKTEECPRCGQVVSAREKVCPVCHECLTCN